MLTDQELFADPQSPPARHLAELRARRLELREEQRTASLKHAQAQDAAEQAAFKVRMAEDRETAFGDRADVKPARTAHAKAAAAVEKTVETLNRLQRGVELVDREIIECARNNMQELLNEVIGQHNTAAEQATRAVSELHRAQAEMRAAYISASLLTNQTAPEINRLLRDVPEAQQIAGTGHVPALLPYIPVKDDDLEKAA